MSRSYPTSHSTAVSAPEEPNPPKMTAEPNPTAKMTAFVPGRCSAVELSWGCDRKVVGSDPRRYPLSFAACV